MKQLNKENRLNAQTVFLSKNQFAEIFASVEIGGGRAYGIPGEIMLNRGELAAFIEVATHLFARLSRKVGEKLSYKGKGDLIGKLPTVLGANNRRIDVCARLGKNSCRILPTGAKAYVHT